MPLLRTDHDENILWQGKPHRLLYTIGNPLIYPFALVWGLFDLMFMRQFNQVGAFAPQGMFAFSNLFILVHLAPVWYAIFTPIYRYFNWLRIQYALTDKRLYFTSGLIGLEVGSAELPEVRNLQVSVGVLEALFRRGTIRFGAGALRFIDNPYEVYKLIQQTALDVVSDREYPNALRPDTNPGYRTRYERDQD